MNRVTRSDSQQRGAVAIIVAITLGLVLVVVGLVIDLRYLYTRKTELQNAADAAALAGAKEINGTAAGINNAVTMAIDLANDNRVNFGGDAVEIEQTVSPSVPIPSGSSGVYYILLKADSSNSIFEENERNNVRYSTPLEAFVITPNDTLHAGVALTFDDGKYIDDWYAYRPILKKYNAHATFFVSNLDSINQSQIEKLRILQADGNEIAFHGYSHLEVVEYLKTHSIGQYLEYEIIPGIDLMRSWGLNPVDFAYPYGSADPAANQVLFGYFGHVRGIHNNNWNDDIYYTYGSNTPFIVSMGIDNHYGNSDETIYAGMEINGWSCRIRRPTNLLIG